MHHSKIKKPFDELVIDSEAYQRKVAIDSNDAFVAAMARAVLKKKEKAVPGTFKDTSPMSPAARRVATADPLQSPTGSPAAWCMGN